jgi:hypothetical protein
MFGLLLFKHTNCLAIYPPLPPGAYDAPPTRVALPRRRSAFPLSLLMRYVHSQHTPGVPILTAGTWLFQLIFVGTLHFTFIGTLQLPWHMWWPAFEWPTQQSHVFLLICGVSIVHLYSVIMRWTSQSSDHGNAATASQPQ